MWMLVACVLPLITHVLDSHIWGSILQEIYQSFKINLEDIPQISKENLKDVNMWPVGLGNTRISTGYAHNSSLDIVL